MGCSDPVKVQESHMRQVHGSKMSPGVSRQVAGSRYDSRSKLTAVVPR